MYLCIISDLISKPFSRKSFSEKSEIIKTGRPCPVIPNLTSVHKDKKENILDILIFHSIIILNINKNELHVLYSSADFKNRPIFDIIKFINY